MKVRIQYSVLGQYVVECKEPGWFKRWKTLKRFDFSGLAQAYMDALTPQSIDDRLRYLQEHEEKEKRLREIKYPERDL